MGDSNGNGIESLGNNKRAWGGNHAGYEVGERVIATYYIYTGTGSSVLGASTTY